MAAWLGILHGVELYLTTSLVGGLVFCKACLPAGGSDALSFDSGRGRRLFSFWVAALIGSVAWYFFVAADMAESWNLNGLGVILTTTSFGRFWMVNFVCLILLGMFLKWNRLGTACLISLGLPLLSALSGHAGAERDHFVRNIVLHYFHYSTVSLWTGGLLALWFWLSSYLKSANRGSAPDLSFLVVRRFSHFAMASTFALAPSGIFLAYSYGVSFSSLWQQDYGRLLLIKSGLFAGALGVASINQFIHLRRWQPGQGHSFALKIRREVSIEIIITTLVFIAVGFLTRTALPDS